MCQLVKLRCIESLLPLALYPDFSFFSLSLFWSFSIWPLWSFLWICGGAPVWVDLSPYGFPGAQCGSPEPFALDMAVCRPLSRTALTCTLRNHAGLRREDECEGNEFIQCYWIKWDSPRVRETWSHMPSSWPKQTEFPSLWSPNSSILKHRNNMQINTDLLYNADNDLSVEWAIYEGVPCHCAPDWFFIVSGHNNHIAFRFLWNEVQHDLQTSIITVSKWRHLKNWL